MRVRYSPGKTRGLDVGPLWGPKIEPKGITVSDEPQRGLTCKPGENPRDAVWPEKQKNPNGVQHLNPGIKGTPQKKYHPLRMVVWFDCP